MSIATSLVNAPYVVPTKLLPPTTGCSVASMSPSSSRFAPFARFNRGASLTGLTMPLTLAVDALPDASATV